MTLYPLRRGKKFPFVNDGHSYLNLAKAFPFYISLRSGYVHRPRAGRHHYLNKEYTHTTLDLWCGGIGFPSSRFRSKGRLLEEFPSDGRLCALCELKAVSQGFAPVKAIVGHSVPLAHANRAKK